MAVVIIIFHHSQHEDAQFHCSWWGGCIFNVLELSWLVELEDSLRPLPGKSYQTKKKNSTEEIGQWLCGKICAERNTSASFFSWYCLANTVWISWNVYFPLHGWSWNYIVFSLSCFMLSVLQYALFLIFLVVCCTGGRNSKVLDTQKMWIL